MLGQSGCAWRSAALPSQRACSVKTLQGHLKATVYAVMARLERLELGMCGRGFGDETAATLAGVGPLPALRCARFGAWPSELCLGFQRVEYQCSIELSLAHFRDLHH